MLTILPLAADGTDEDDILCLLEHVPYQRFRRNSVYGVDFELIPVAYRPTWGEYAALSYEWGNQPPVSSICVGDARIAAMLHGYESGLFISGRYIRDM